MNLDRDIGTMLRGRAEGVAAAPTIPHRMLRRVRVRKTLMTGGVAAVVAVLLFCGCSASGSLSNDAAPTRPANETEKNDPTVNLPYLTTTFVSPTYGYSFKYLDRGGLAPATELWDPVNEQFDDNKQFDDRFDAVETGLGAYFAAASTEVPEGVSIDEWVDEYVSLAAAVSLAASKRRSPSMGSRAGSRSVRTGSRQPSSRAGGSISSPCCTCAVTPELSSTPGSGRSTCVRRPQRSLKPVRSGSRRLFPAGCPDLEYGSYKVERLCDCSRRQWMVIRRPLTETIFIDFAATDRIGIHTVQSRGLY